MSQQYEKSSVTARWIALSISFFVIALGAFIIIQGYAPGIYTRFGYAEALFGLKAKALGLIIILLGLLPLLLFCKSSRQAATLGTILGLSLLFIIFYTAYS